MIANLNLDPDELITLSEAAIKHPDCEVRHRALSLFWIYYGFSLENLPNAKAYYPERVKQWVVDYEEFGFAGLATSCAVEPVYTMN